MKLISKWEIIFQNYVHQSLNHLKATDDDINKVRSLFGKTGCPPSAIMTNEYVRSTAMRSVYHALKNIRENEPDAEFVWVTIISKDWEVSDEQTVIDFCSIHSQVRQTLSAMSPHYFAVMEATPFSNVKHSVGGKTLSTHVHAIVWGPDAHRRATKVKKKHSKRYAESFTKAPTIKVKRIRANKVNLARLVSYSLKPPHSCKNYYQSTDGTKRNLHEGTKNLRFVRFLRQAQIHSMITINKATFAGGQGSVVRKSMMKAVKAKITSKSKPGAELIHRDAIPHFWAELMPRLGQSRFQLPFIRTRK